MKIDNDDKIIEKINRKYEADIISGAIRSRQKGLYIPPVKYKSIANWLVSNNKK